MIAQTEHELTGYPSVDKPWLKNYDKALTEEDIPKCSAFRMLYEKNKDYLTDTALLYFHKKMTYKMLFQKIEKAAAALAALGIGKGDIVTLQTLNMPQTIILFYALSYIGAVANSIFVTEGEEELHDILLTTESKMYITMDSFWSSHRNAVSGTDVTHVLLLQVAQEADTVTKIVLSVKRKSPNAECLTWNTFLAFGNKKADEVNDSSLPMAMVYTGGTTGKSKAVVLSSKNLNALVMQYEHTYVGLKRGGVFMNSLPTFIAFGIVCSMHMPLCLGIVNIIVADPTPMNSGKYFAKYKPNYFVNGIAGIESIINHPKVRKMKLDFIKVLAAGGEPVPVSLEEKTNHFLREHQSNARLCIGYGMTEVASTVVTSSPRADRMGTVGIPLPETVVKIVEPETTRELTYDVEGEICFHTPTMMLGYYKEEEETKNIIKLHPDGMLWVHSGDIGRISRDGFLVVVGRIKRIISIRKDGIYHKVFSKLIEETLGKADGVEGIVIVGREKPAIEHELVAFVVKNSQREEEEVKCQLQKYAQKNMETWERPIEYRFVENFPRTDVGKINYRKLEEMAK